MPAKSKRLTNKEKALKAKVKKELQEQGLLPPDKPRLNRRKFAKEAAEQFDKEINLMNPIFCTHPGQLLPSQTSWFLHEAFLSPQLFS